MEDRGGAVRERERSRQDLDHGPAARHRDPLHLRHGLGRVAHRLVRLTHLGRPVAGRAGARRARDLEMGLHAELLVRVFPHWAIHFVGPRLQCQRQRVSRARLDRLNLLFDPLSLDLEAVRDAAGVGDGEPHRPRRDGLLRQLHLPLREPDVHLGRGVGMRARRYAHQSAEQRNREDGPTRDTVRNAVHNDLVRRGVTWNAFTPKTREAAFLFPS